VQLSERQVLGNDDAPPDRRAQATQRNAKLKDRDRRPGIGCHARIVGVSLAARQRSGRPPPLWRGLLQEETIRPAHDKLLSYIRQLSEISDAAQLDFPTFIEAVQEANAENLQAFFAKVSEASPVASESSVAIVKSAIRAAQAAYVSVQQVTKETTELANS